jgi:Tfp pilus assembly protein PilF
VPGGERGGVFAYVHELELWLNDPRAKHAAVKQPSLPEVSEPVGEAKPPLAASAASNHTNPEAIDSPQEDTLPPGRAPYTILSIGLWTLAGILITVGVAGVAVYSQKPNSPSAESASASETRSARAKNYVPDPDAAELYLKGRYYWNMRTGASLNQAVDYFTQSIVHDPQYAPSYAGLADCYLLLREYSSMPENEAFPRAIAAARKAMELDPSSSEAHRALAFALHYWDWDLPRAEQEFRRALQLNPNDAEAHHWYATSMIASGRYSDALTQIDEARRLQPMSTSVLADRDLILLLAGRQQEAIAALRQLESAEPAFHSTHVYLAEAYLLTHNPTGYLNELSRVASLNKDDKLLSVAAFGRQALARGGEPAMYDALARQYGKLADQGQGLAYSAASFYAMAGNKQETLSYLTTSYSRRESNFLSARLDPCFASLRQDPQFQALAGRVETASRRN